MDEVIDTDGDGIPDALVTGTDLDGDGVPELIETVVDVNNDGVADIVSMDIDVDGNGQIDLTAVVTDMDGDGQVELLASPDAADAVWGNVNSVVLPSSLYSDPHDLLSTSHADFTFAGSQEFYEVHGTPLADMQLWEVQDSPNSCAVATTNMMLRSVGIANVGEDDLAALFQSEGIYDPTTGTQPDLIDDVINAAAAREGLDIHAVEHKGFDIDELQQMLDDGIRPLVGVDSNELYHDPGVTFNELCHIPDAGHAIQVTGIIHSPEGDYVVINDPAFEGGAAQNIPLDRFMDAADDFGFMAVAVRHS